MKIDAHYYAVLGFSRACGFKRDPALLLAYASQFVDDARTNHIVIHGDPAGIDHDIIEKEPSFFNMATCHSYSRVKTFNYSSMTGNTTPFHFVPGLKGASFPKKLRCAEESSIITTIVNEDLIEGLKTAIFVLEKEEKLPKERKKSMIESLKGLIAQSEEIYAGAQTKH